MDFNKLIDEYIYKCDCVLNNSKIPMAMNTAKIYEDEIISVFQNIIPDIFVGLDAYSYGGDYISDIRKLKGKLSVLKAIQGDYKRFNPKASNFSINNSNGINNSGNSTNNNTNTQNQTVTNAFDIKVQLDKVRAEVEADEVLDDDAKEEINEKLNEIEEVMNSSSTNNEKWKKLKSTFSWIATKSYKIGQWIMPIITKALFGDEG